MDSSLLFLVPLFLFSSVFYALIGQGGASAYLAFLALFNVPYGTIPSTSLACNIAVSLGTVWHFKKAGYLKYRLTLPFAITSIPAAFYFGTLNVPELTFKIILIVLLLLISIKSFFHDGSNDKIKHPSLKTAYIFGPIIGCILGAVSGSIGIGGGILLMPVIMLLRWGNVKEAAVAGGLFTLLNSVSGLLGHGIHGTIDWNLLVPLLAAVIIGGQIGAHLGAKKLSADVIQKIFSFILLFVAVRLTVSLF